MYVKYMYIKLYEMFYLISGEDDKSDNAFLKYLSKCHIWKRERDKQEILIQVCNNYDRDKEFWLIIHRTNNQHSLEGSGQGWFIDEVIFKLNPEGKLGLKK